MKLNLFATLVAVLDPVALFPVCETSLPSSKQPFAVHRRFGLLSVIGAGDSAWKR